MPTTILQLLAWLTEHWFGAILFAIVAGILIWRWSVAGKDSGEGPVAYAKKKHQFFFFIIGMVTLILVTLFIVFAGPWFGKFFTWAISTGVTNTETVIMGNPTSIVIASPTVAQNQNLALGTPTAGAATNLAVATTGFTSTMCTTSAATVRSQPNSTADGPTGLGTIPAGTTITMNAVIDSNCVANAQGVNVCQRGQLADQVGSFPAGSWVHLAVLDTNACP